MLAKALGIHLNLKVLNIMEGEHLKPEFDKVIVSGLIVILLLHFEELCCHFVNSLLRYQIHDWITIFQTNIEDETQIIPQGVGVINRSMDFWFKLLTKFNS